MIILDNNFIDNIFLEKWGRIPKGGKDRAKIMTKFGFKCKRGVNSGSKASFFDSYKVDMIHCNWCDFLGFEPIHSYSFIEHNKRHSYCNKILNMETYRNYVRTGEELKTAANSRIMESVLRLWMKDIGKEILNPLEIEKQCYEKFGGKKCFLTGKTKNLNIDHTLPLDRGWPQTVKNSTPLHKNKNSSKRALWPGEFYSKKELKELSKITGYTLEELQTPRYNYPFFKWCDENWNIVEEYIMIERGKLKKVGGKKKFLENLKEKINLAKSEQLGIFFDNL